MEAGLRAALIDPGLLTAAQGCDFEAPIEGGIEAAVDAALQADVVLLAIGEPSDFSGEAQSRTQIIIPPAQQALAEAVAATGKPVVVLLRNGRALALTGAVRDAQAILVTWFLGTQTGPAVADVVFGDYNPSAKLPVSFPQDAGQQPFYYNHPSTGRPNIPGQPRFFQTRWREVTHTALFPFGHGLSYTRFEYGRPTLSDEKLMWDGTLTLRARITNVGDRQGEEVVQLYIRDRVASRVRPVRELKRFAKVMLAAGETQEVVFTLSRQDFIFYGTDNRPIAEPGWFDAWIAPSSANGEAVAFELLAP